MDSLPSLSRFELQCLRKLSDRGEATVRQIHNDLTDPPSYSTVRKIVDRLEEKGAVRRIGKRHRAWVYRPAIPASKLIRKEIRRFLDVAFDGAAAPLIAQLADMNAVTLEDIKAIESQLRDDRPKARKKRRKPGESHAA